MSELPGSPPPARPRARDVHAGRLLLGLALAVLGVLWLLEALDVTTIDWDIGLPVAVIAVGVALLVAGFVGRTSGGLVALGIVLTIVLVATTFVEVPFGAGVGDRTVRPLAVAERTYELSIGKLTIDLTRSSLPTTSSQQVRLTGHVGIGQLVVVVPSGSTGVDVRAKAGVGDVQVFGRDHGGFGVEYRSPGRNDVAPLLVLELSVGVGQVEVRRG
jgi:cell wall-active antibiotic response 4TMS protein YvqF